MSELNKDFDSLVSEINAKLNEAAAALKQANELRVKAGLPSLFYSSWRREEDYSEIAERLETSGEFVNDEELEDAINQAVDDRHRQFIKIDKRALENEINKAGWSTSSSYC